MTRLALAFALLLSAATQHHPYHMRWHIPASDCDPYLFQVQETGCRYRALIEA
jgi:hypothetical protein